MVSGRTGKILWQLAISLPLTLSLPAVAQECAPADISLSTQQSVDSFQLNHGPCDTVTGKLSIVGNDISNLDGLSEVTAIDGDLFISDSPLLASIAGLKSLSNVGGDLTLQANGALESTDGLNSLQAVNGNFFIFRNNELQHLDGLESLDSVGDRFYLSGNETLTHVHGLEGLSSIGGTLRIWDNARLSNLDGFAGLVSVHGSLEIVTSPSLMNLGGLSNLRTVGGDLLIQANNSLVSIQGLSSLDSDIGILAILGNPLITNVDGLDSLTRAGQLIITNNGSLSDCLGVLKLVDPIDNGEQGHEYALPNAPDVGGYLNLHGNRPGCNAVAEILAEVPLLELNAGLNDAWLSQETDGQGFFFIVFPQIQQVFMAWFTYDIERPSEDVTADLGEPGHRWLTAQGGYQDRGADLDVYVTSGGVFDSPNPAAVAVQDGRISVEFETCNSGRVTYDIPSINRQGVVEIERIVLDNVAACYVLDNQAAEGL